jgi:hypothetical protein
VTAQKAEKAPEYRVMGALADVWQPSGQVVTYYRGDKLPASVPKKTVEHLLSVGLIAAE